MNIIVNVLCEGATEESFVKKVLSPYLKEFGVIVKVRQLTTSKKKGAHGGMGSYQRAKNDFLLWQKENSNDRYCTHYYTSMFDYYQLSTDFPGFPPEGKDSVNKVEALEKALSEDLNLSSFIPYIQLYEFEALVFAGLDYLRSDYPDKEKAIDGLKKELELCHNAPEEVNNHPTTAPSKRLEKALGKYNKVKSGIMVAGEVGIERLKEQCPHFKEWINCLEALGTQNI